MMKHIKTLALGAAMLLLASCASDDDKMLEYCTGISDASESFVKMRDEGMAKEAIIALLRQSDIAEDTVTLQHVERNINFAYRYPKMPMRIYHKEVFNQCLAVK